MRGFGTIPDIASLIRATKVMPMSIAEAYDIPLTRAPLVPPSPPRAPDDMTALGRAGLPDDIGPMIASLLSEDNRWVNAQRIEVSGGMSI